MNRKVKEKLNSKRGASVVLALFLLLVCTFAGTSALTAARANVGRYSTMRETQQDYLSVTSAAKLIIEDIKSCAPDENTGTPKVTGTVPRTGVSTVDTPYDSFFEIIRDDVARLMQNEVAQDSDVRANAAWSGFKSNSDPIVEKTFHIDVKDNENKVVGMETVTGSYKLDNNGNILVRLSCGSYNYYFEMGITVEVDSVTDIEAICEVSDIQYESTEIRPDIKSEVS